MGIVHAKSPDRSNFFSEHPMKFPEIDYDADYDLNERDVPIKGIPAQVDNVHVDGLQRTKDDYVSDCFGELFEATDLEDVLLKAHRARLKLEELGCFRNIAVFIDTSKGRSASPNGLDITYTVKEYRRLTGGVSTQVGDNEGSLLIGMRAPNMYGRGERVQVEYSHGSKKNTQFSLSFIKPFRGRFRPIITASLFQNNAESPQSGFREHGQGVILDLGFHSSSIIKHNLQWEGVIRALEATGKSTSFQVREKAGATLKSALRYILSIDSRDDNIFPNEGCLLHNTTEVAGLGGDIGFAKHEVFLQSNFSLIEDMVLQGCFGFGLMKGLGNDMKISLSDMFFLGGPLSLRGFQMRGVGPHSQGDATGALAYWAAGLHLFTPLPFRPGRGGLGELFRTHFFVNAGNIGEFPSESGGDESFFKSVRENFRLSYGIGLAVRLGNMARIELNYCVPHIFSEEDLTQPGVQFGIGVRFL